MSELKRGWIRTVLAIVVTLGAGDAVHGQGPTPVSPVPAPTSSSKPAVAASLETFTAGWLRKSLTGARPGSCRAASPVSPVSSWPARGEPAITFCKR
jgi:hypothetical protein